MMVGTITIFYGNSVKDLQSERAGLQRENITSPDANLDKDPTLEAVLLQDPAGSVRQIADLGIAKRGVISGKLDLVAALIPQIHPFR